VELSNDQVNALKLILTWYKDTNRKPFITLGGYAGTGKSTLITEIKNQLNLNYKECKIAFCSYTGRATQNLKQKLKEANTQIRPGDIISTVHGLIYVPIENGDGVITGWSKKESIDVNLIIIDESSMIDENIWTDLLSFNVPIIAVGDHGQLPPINGKFNLMEIPEILLEEIHRQAQDNPIIEVSIQARQSGKIQAKRFGNKVIKYTPEDFDFNEISQELLQNYNNDTLILCGYNSTRTKLNQFVRAARDIEEQKPVIGDRVICLRNNHKKGIYNGMLGTINNIFEKNDLWYDTEIFMDDTAVLYKGLIYAPQFGAAQPINFTQDRLKAKGGDLFDFGYALTVHKSQGSQAKRVILFEERFSKMDDDQWKRWLYTAVTRAEEELYIFGAS
jgi:exodeoxyribonuclease V